MMTWLPSCTARSRSVPSGSLPAAARTSGRLDAVIERVAHRVGQRILDGLKQALVQFGVLAFHLQAHPAAQRLREVAHHARHLGKDVRDRLHARLHHRLRAGRPSPCRGGAKACVMLGSADGGLQHLVAGEHQFADQIHHPVEQGDVDAQRAFGGRAGRGCGRRRRGLAWRWQRAWLARSRSAGRLEASRMSSQSGAGRLREAARPCRALTCARARRSVAASASLRAARSTPRPSPSPSLASASMVFRIERSPSSSCSSPVITCPSAASLPSRKQPQQVLAGMRQLLQPLESQKARGSLDRVHGAKDLRQQVRVAGPRLQIGQAPLHPVQAFLALDQELPRQFVHLLTASTPAPDSGSGRGSIRLALSEKWGAT